MKIIEKVNELVEYLADTDFFMCETRSQAIAMSDGFVKEARQLREMIEQMQQHIFWQEARYKETMEAKDLLCKEVQAARIYKEIIESKGN